jgi:hypothetical protein
MFSHKNNFMDISFNQDYYDKLVNSKYFNPILNNESFWSQDNLKLYATEKYNSTTTENDIECMNNNLDMCKELWIDDHGYRITEIDEVTELQILFLQKIDKLNLLNSYFTCDISNNFKLISPNTVVNKQDLRSIMNINLIDEYSNLNDKKQINILDIGGGYGRLGEVIMNILPLKYL